MMPLLKRFFLVFAVFVSGLSANAANFDLGKTGDLFIDVPASWDVKTRLVEGKGYEFIVTPSNGINAKAVLAVVPLTPPRAVDAKRIDRELTALCQRFVADSVEKKAVLQPFTLPNGYGAFSIFTDSSLVGQPAKPGDYKLIVPGLVQPTDSFQIVAMLFADDAEGPELVAMRNLTKSIRLTPPAKP